MLGVWEYWSWRSRRESSLRAEGLGAEAVVKSSRGKEQPTVWTAIVFFFFIMSPSAATTKAR